MVQMNPTKKRGVTRALGTGEERSAEALTVLWMLTAVACLAAQIVAAGTRALLVWSAAGRQIIGPMVPGWFSFCALVTATICLGLTPLVWYVRRQKPPPSVLLAVLVISLVPWAMVVFQMF
ncbi:MAG: hypothetical protein KatS3mg110_4454 [Pirellulaceae bacterium]|nr:MAG: hypothetical protein KatS3mg110_4454 [Pirellulaceae bacterium]